MAELESFDQNMQPRYTAMTAVAALAIATIICHMGHLLMIM